VIKSVQNPNISKLELDKLTLGAAQYSALDEKYNRLRGQMQSFGSLYKTQIDQIRQSGIRLENEGAMDQLLRGENIQTSIANGIVSVVETRDKVI
jgi:hypothetical protein